MIITSNAHTHTSFCDGKNTPQQMVEAAILKGFSAIGFSSHSYFEKDTGSMSIKSTAEYIKQINALKKQYADRIAVFLGLEQEFYSPEILGEFDYKIGSVHYVKGDDGKFYAVDSSKQEFALAIKEGFGGNAMAFVKRYYETYNEMLQKLKPDIAGHFDLVRKFNHNNAFFDENSAEYKKLAQEVLVNNISQLYEVNTGGIWRGYRTTPYPAKWMLDILSENGTNVIITSDAHSAEGIDCYFYEARRLIKQCGFKCEIVLSPNGFISQSL